MLQLRNYIDGVWRISDATEYRDVFDPATAEILAQTPLSPAGEGRLPLVRRTRARTRG